MDNIEKLASAMVKVQAEIKVAKKDKSNPFFKSKYADLGAIWEAIHEAMTRNEIAVIQRPAFRDGVSLLITDLIHSSGQSLSGEYLVRPVKDDPQAMGSAGTYARRYSLAAMVGIIQEDDDAKIAAMTRGAKADSSKIKEKLAAKDGNAAVGDRISESEARALFKIWKTAGKSNEDVAVYLRGTWGHSSTSEIRRSEYGKILEWCGKRGA